ncbi:MAG: TetR/AcrR family transcriptional regulator [Hyphomonadaceae bacterium]|nr:TetR/AcrR family transcriptional regulator [Hyphomonadaceae bacterium]
MPVRQRATEPVQARAQATREELITAAAELLGEVGVERLSTNLICARAGLTPPAFYRYFKDKYAILEELGERLMDAQNQAIGRLLQDETLDVTEADISQLILDSITITRAFPGGPWVLRALRAVPALHHVRLNSHRKMSEQVAQSVTARGAPSALVKLQARLLIDMGYAAIELAFDEPRLKREALAQTAAQTLAGLVAALQAQAQAQN